MPWWLKVLGLFAFALALGLLGQAIRNRRARRTIAAWSGDGVNRDLLPFEAALILGHPPSAIVFHLIHLLEMGGRARLRSIDPIRVDWIGGTPGDRVEEALVAALDEEGRLSPEGILGLLESIYDRVNERMIPFSGRRTAVHYRWLVTRLGDDALEAGKLAPELEPWLLLLEVHGVWDALGEDAEAARLKQRFRAKARFEERLVDRDLYRQAHREATSGFFSFWRDAYAPGPYRGRTRPDWVFRR